MLIEDLIESYLLRNQFCPLPKLGTLVLHEKNAQIEINRRDADILALRSVQRVKIKPVVCRAEGKDSNFSTTNETSYAELDPETAVRAFGVTDDGDKAIKQLNELQNRVRQLVSVCPIEIL